MLCVACLREQVAWCAAERLRQRVQVQDPDVPLPALQRANVGAVKARRFCEGFLSESSRSAKLTHTGSEFLQHALGVDVAHLDSTSA